MKKSYKNRVRGFTPLDFKLFLTFGRKKGFRSITSNKNVNLTENLTGFTLIELLVVIAIIGVLATLATAAFSYAKNRAKIVKAQNDVAQIEKAINMLANDVGYWPGHQDMGKTATQAGNTNNNEICADGCAYGLGAGESGIVANDTGDSYVNWGGPYMTPMPADPWGHEYFFDTDYQVTAADEPCNGAGGCVEAVVVGSYGEDGIGNNQYNGDDVIKVMYK